MYGVRLGVKEGGSVIDNMMIDNGWMRHKHQNATFTSVLRSTWVGRKLRVGAFLGSEALISYDITKERTNYFDPD